MPSSYPPESRREAVAMVRSGRSIKDVSEALGMTAQGLRAWVRQEQVDRHERDNGLTTGEREELRRFRRDNARLKQERDCSNEPPHTL